MRINAPIATRVPCAPAPRTVCACAPGVTCSACLDYAQHEAPPAWRVLQQLGGLEGQLKRHRARLPLEEARWAEVQVQPASRAIGDGARQRQYGKLKYVRLVIARLEAQIQALRERMEEEI